jgi:SAM-dependent methyltransferase
LEKLEPLREFHATALREHPSPRRLAIYMERLFSGVPLEGMRLLDVGGGSGTMSFYAAARGAAVVCLEPAAAGSNPRMDEMFEAYRSALGAQVDVRLERQTFQEYDPDEPFDVVLLHNSINHLDEEACQHLHHDQAARELFRAQFRRMAAMTAPGGHLVAADCSRLNLFGVLRVRNPFVPDIEWHIHQQPRVWAALLAESGFTNAQIRWNPMTRAGRAGEVLLANWVGAFLTTSHFTIHMQRSTG